MSQIDEQIWIGNLGDSVNTMFQNERGIRHILCCAKELHSISRPNSYKLALIDDTVDHGTEYMIREGAAKLDEWVRTGHKVMVHSYAGMSRSVSVVIAYYMLYKGWSYDIAYSHCKQRRKQTNPHPDFVKILRRLTSNTNTKIPGISFVVRARNEEAYLTECLSSLKLITVPHEIIVILHKCSDGSEAIAKAALAGGQPVRILKTDQDLSKAGYETVVTPANHPASLMSFYTWCFSHAKYIWLFKWDADFTASPELVEFLNTGLILDEVAPVYYIVPCHMTGDIVNREKYLFNCLITYKKWVFWELPSFPPNVEGRSIDAKIYTIPPTVLKPYWKEPPWFIGKDSKLEDLYKKITIFCGPEPIGASRAQCKDCETPYFSILSCRDFLATLGIYTNQ